MVPMRVELLWEVLCRRGKSVEPLSARARMNYFGMIFRGGVNVDNVSVD